jgi:hypothetical protein
LFAQLIPNLETKSVIVVDNASYHNVQLYRHPTSNARKGELLFCLDKHGIRYSTDVTKAELYDLVGSLSYVLLLVGLLDNPRVRGRMQQYWLLTQVACFLFTSSPVCHRVPSSFKPSLKSTAVNLELTENSVFFCY